MGLPTDLLRGWINLTPLDSSNHGQDAFPRAEETWKQTETTERERPVHKVRLVGSVLPEEMVFRWDMGMWDFEPGLLPRMLGKG